MKKTILTFAITVISTVTFAQSMPVKKDTSKVKYDYFVKLSVNDVQQYLGILKEYKDLVIYDPKATSDQKINMQIGIDKYLKTLTEKIKIDSLVKK